MTEKLKPCPAAHSDCEFLIKDGGLISCSCGWFWDQGQTAYRAAKVWNHRPLEVTYPVDTGGEPMRVWWVADKRGDGYGLATGEAEAKFAMSLGRRVIEGTIPAPKFEEEKDAD